MSDVLTTSIPKLEAVTEKYRFISSAEFIKDVEAQGFKLDRTRRPRSGFGKHLMVFRSEKVPKLNDSAIELVTMNSHDGSSAFRLYLGVFRFICENGMIAGECLNAQRIVHLGYARDKVAAAVHEVMQQADTLTRRVERLENTRPSWHKQFAFGNAAAELRGNQPESIVELMTPHRQADGGSDAWSILNVVQENILQGNYHNDKGRKAKRIANIGENVRINRALWDLAEKHLLAA